MTFQDWRDLAILSVRNPPSAAQTLMAMKFDTRSLWEALLLVAIGNTLLYFLSHILMPAPTMLPGLFESPLLYFIMVAGGLALTVLALYRIGRMMGGQAALADILVLVVWLQSLRLLVQVAVLVLAFVLPLLSALLVLAAALVGIFILVHFVDQAHRFNSRGRAVWVLIVSMLAIVLGLSFILTLLGGFVVGSMPNV